MQANLSTIRARRLFISQELEVLQAEDAELEMAEAVLVRLAGHGARAAMTSMPSKRGRIPGRATIVGAAVAKKLNAKAETKGGKPAIAKASRRGRNRSGVSQRDLVLDALKKSRAPWLSIKEIITLTKASHGQAMPPRSLSPLLSVMKNTGVIVRDGRKVALPARAKAR